MRCAYNNKIDKDDTYPVYARARARGFACGAVHPIQSMLCLLPGQGIQSRMSSKASCWFAFRVLARCHGDEAGFSLRAD